MIRRLVRGPFLAVACLCCLVAGACAGSDGEQLSGEPVASTSTTEPSSTGAASATTTDTSPSTDTTAATTTAPTGTDTASSTDTDTDTATVPSTDTDTDTASSTDTDTDTASSTDTDTDTDTASSTDTDTDTASSTDTATDTDTASSTDTDTDTASSTDTDTDTDTASSTDTATDTDTASSTDTATDAPTNGSTDTATDAPTNGSTDTATGAPTNGSTSTATDAPTNGSTSTAPSTDTATTTTTAPSGTSAPAGTTSPGEVAVSPWPSDPRTASDRDWRVRIEASWRHDTDAFTQGLETHGSIIYESTGLYGESRLRALDGADELRSVAIDGDLFGEGLTLVGDEIIQLSWREGRALRWDRDTFEARGEFRYEGEGWGICWDDGGSRLFMSDGSSTLTHRNRDFAVVATTTILRSNEPVRRINELECVDGLVVANIWMSNEIIVIDPDSGEVLVSIDAASLAAEAGISAQENNEVLNGIAYNGDGNWILGGKNWPLQFLVTLTLN